MKTISPKNIRIRGARRGFTIIETLVAVAVLMIAVAGPLVVATKGLRSAQISKNQMIASYLAQETLEVVRNYKDNKIATEGVAAWVDQVTTDYNLRCDPNVFGETCDIQLLASGQFQFIEGCPSAGCPIYLVDGRYYSSSGGGQSVETQFRRRYRIIASGVSGNATVHTYVAWNEGTIPYEVHLVAALSPTIR